MTAEALDDLEVLLGRLFVNVAFFPCRAAAIQTVPALGGAVIVRDETAGLQIIDIERFF
jgi:hypothetical protein